MSFRQCDDFYSLLQSTLMILDVFDLQITMKYLV